MFDYAADAAFSSDADCLSLMMLMLMMPSTMMSLLYIAISAILPPCERILRHYWLLLMTLLILMMIDAIIFITPLFSMLMMPSMMPHWCRLITLMLILIDDDADVFHWFRWFSSDIFHLVPMPPHYYWCLRWLFIYDDHYDAMIILRRWYAFFDSFSPCCHLPCFSLIFSAISPQQIRCFAADYCWWLLRCWDDIAITLIFDYII